MRAVAGCRDLLVEKLVREGCERLLLTREVRFLVENGRCSGMLSTVY